MTDNGSPFRSFRFEAFIATHPELRHVRTRVRAPGQNGSRERGFGSLKYEKLFLEEIPDALELVRHAEDYRSEYNTVRPHEALAWNRPHDVHTGAADPSSPTFPAAKSCQQVDAGHPQQENCRRVAIRKPSRPGLANYDVRPPRDLRALARASRTIVSGHSCPRRDEPAGAAVRSSGYRPVAALALIPSHWAPLISMGRTAAS
ncbi:integrase core domain-containing protein [Streptacidiphilus sp. BW17]|uniref:integrase core domain-containing protein n=1 Tax=Streptacidiphilus sp. BW17 TaxID=3156274 RepID=UPI00351318B7